MGTFKIKLYDDRPLEDKGALREKIVESVQSYLDKGGKIEFVEGINTKSISQDEIVEMFDITKEHLQSLIRKREFVPTASNAPASRKRDGSEKYMLFEVERYFKRAKKTIINGQAYYESQRLLNK